MRERLVIRVSGGFCLLLTLLLFLDEQNFVPWALAACTLHELGHLATIHLLGGRVVAFRLSVVGAELVPGRARLFSYREELIIAAAGPLVSLVAAFLAACLAKAGGDFGERAYLFAGLNLVAGLFNLLPLAPLDGGRILHSLLLRSRESWELERLYQRLSCALSLGLLCLGTWQMLDFGGNPTLLLSGLWLFWGQREPRTNV